MKNEKRKALNMPFLSGELLNMLLFGVFWAMKMQKAIQPDQNVKDQMMNHQPNKSTREPRAKTSEPRAKAKAPPIPTKEKPLWVDEPKPVEAKKSKKTKYVETQT